MMRDRCKRVGRFLRAYPAPFQLLIARRALLRQLIRRDRVTRTNGTLLGGLWLVLQPALQVLAFWFLLDFVLQVRSPGRVAFVDYFLVAMLPWLLIQECLQRNLLALSEFSALYQRTLFPVSLIPWVPLLMAGLVYLPVYVGVVGLLTGSWLAMIKAAAVVVGVVIWLVPFSYGMALIGLFFRESRQVVPFLLTLSMYLTPILYPPESLPVAVRGWLAWNGLADGVATIEHLIHGLPLTTGQLVRPWLLWLIALPIAWHLFRRAEPHMREEL